MVGLLDRTPAMSGLVKPLEYKNSNLGKRVFLGSDESTEGPLPIMFEIWVCKKPWFLKKAITKLALFGFSKLTNLEAERAVSGDKLHEFMR